jgi:hypothetical protein
MPTKEELKRATERAKEAARRAALRLSATAKSPQQSRDAAAALRATLPEGYEEEYRQREARKKAIKERVAAVGKSQGERRSIFASPVPQNENQQQRYNRERYEAFKEHARRLRDVADSKYRRWAAESKGYDVEVPDFDEEALEEVGAFVFKNPPPGVKALRFGEVGHHGDVELQIEREHAEWRRQIDEEDKDMATANAAKATAAAAAGGTSGSGRKRRGGMMPRGPPPQALNPNAADFMPRLPPKPYGENPFNYDAANRLVFQRSFWEGNQNPYLPHSVASAVGNVLDGEGHPRYRFHSREYAGRGRLGFMNPLPGSSRAW